MIDFTQFENYLDGQYVGAFSVEKPFGPHVRKCVCKPCHAAFLARMEESKAKYEAAEAALTPEQREKRNKMASEILERITKNPRPGKKPRPAKNLKVGDRVIVRTSNEVSLNEARVGTVVEMPGPSKKYGGMDAQRIEVLLDATIDNEWETMWTDNNQWGWLEIV